ncbi:TPA: hypothetical protein DCR49_08495 [Candidatus Delongbacteria bacterium]|nr:MAG: hypothetical protein A2Y39_04630 [Candidatus Delongbacteria bacterium GWF2_40_14]HAQ62015.1 hypothetical protein [Candidatus Delongbacteria bacterium]
MREKIYLFIADLVTKHNKKTLFVILLFTAIMLYFSTGLGIKNRLADMLPSNIPQVESFNKIIEDFTSDAVIMISINSASKDERRMIEAAEYTGREMSVMNHIKPSDGQKLSLFQRWKIFRGEYPVEGVGYDTINFIKRVDIKLDTEFFLKHGAIIQKHKDLKNFTAMYRELEFKDLLRNINDNFEQEFVSDSENLSSLDGEARAVTGLNNIYNFISSFSIYVDDRNSAKVKESVKKFIIGDDYYFSPDRSMLLMELMPSVSTDDFDNLLIMSRIATQRMKSIQQKFPDLEFGLAGTPVIGLQEQDAILRDFGWTTILALVIVMIVMLGSFRSWRNPFNSTLTLIVSIIVTSGIFAVTLKYLNTMSAAFGVMLVGLGIDYAIHFLTGYKDATDHGDDPEKAVRTMFLTVGNGVLTGAVTTAAVFFILIIIGFRAFSEMGFAMGLGITIAMIMMFILLPSLIIRDSRKHKKLKRFDEFGAKLFSLKPFTYITGIMQYRFMENIGRLSKNTYYIIFILASGITVTAFSIYGAYRLEYEYDMTNLEPKGMPAIEAQENIIEKLEISPDFAMFSDSNIDSVRSKVAKLKKLADRTDLIGRIDAVTEFFVPEHEQLKNKGLLADFRKDISQSSSEKNVNEENVDEIIDELQRLHDNFVEIGELSVAGSGEKNKIIAKTDEIAGKTDSESKILFIKNKLESSENREDIIDGFQRAYIPELKKIMFDITDTATVTYENLPEEIRERYANKTTGNILVSIYPKTNIWEERNLRKFYEQTSLIEDSITGMPIIMLIFIDLIKVKGLESVLWGLLVIVLVLLIDFRSFKYTAIALIPLILGMIWMLGIMYLFGMKLNINNFMALPIIIGIGIDDGVHMLHRYKIEGRNSMDKVTKFTGKAVLLTSLTTIIGFGSVATASHRGLASMGLVLVIGVATCFITSAFLLPAIISLKDKIKYKEHK